MEQKVSEFMESAWVEIKDRVSHFYLAGPVVASRGRRFEYFYHNEKDF